MIRIGLVFALCVLAASIPAAAEDPPKRPTVPAALRDAIAAYLAAPEAKEAEPLRKAVAAAKGDILAAAEALRTHAPLTDGKPGVTHRLAFWSRKKQFEYSVLLPRKYDGTRRHPVLLLPDHASVTAEDGIGFWEGKEGAEDLIVFRPVITKHQTDGDRFSQGASRDAEMAQAMRDAIRTLRLLYAVDHDRIFMTGLSQAGYYTWWYGVTMPDQFAALLPESAGGGAVTAHVEPLARNLSGTAVRILHSEGDQITPFANAKAMHAAIAAAGGKPELITYTDGDYPGRPFPKRHPGPHHLRLKHVLEWGRVQTRTIPTEMTRTIGSSAQGFEGRFSFEPGDEPVNRIEAKFSETGGNLTVTGVRRVRYRVSPEDAAAGREFTVGTRKVVPKPNIELLIRDFKSHGDPSRMCAAEIEL